jgi:hypothetical protein
MPEKTHFGKLPHSGLREVGFELHRRPITESGGKPFLVIDLFEKFADLGPRLGQVPVFVAMNLLVLQGFHE